MSILVLIYILNYIDRNNAAAARLRGFERDLHLEGTQFASILSVLYVGYILMQVPSNMFLNYVGKPSLYLPACMVVWGLISVGTGLATGFLGALVARFFLGFVEAAFFPGALFLLSRWYTRSELSQRTAILTSGSLLSNAFGSLIASAILDSMQGVLGYAAWRWLFFVEGSMTVVVAIASIWILPDFPETPSNWLTPKEQALAVRRMEEEAAISTLYEAKVTESNGLRLALADGKVWWLASTLFCIVVCLSFNAYFPTLSATMGFNRTITLLLCAPPWIFATAVALAVSRHSDRVGERFSHIVMPFLVGILGFAMAMSTMNTGIRYVSLFLMAQSYAGFICFLAWASSSIAHPPAKRAVGLAFINAFSSLGNIPGSYVWPLSWGPSYWNSYAICILMISIAIFMCYRFRRHLAQLNESKRQLEEQRGEPAGYRYLL
ncbi:MFS general substrate transporter [Pluteus cervinus]|uniref:MFS general substrate transporter n=1 Tax=Pluteus cervinus TaxID=181527 RepID=A0ACD3BDT2_9AGAR|nr:MFS general substrate transporter [Pluteus cervinus]